MSWPVLLICNSIRLPETGLSRGSNLSLSLEVSLETRYRCKIWASVVFIDIMAKVLPAIQKKIQKLRVISVPNFFFLFSVIIEFDKLVWQHRCFFYHLKLKYFHIISYLIIKILFHVYLLNKSIWKNISFQ